MPKEIIFTGIKQVETRKCPKETITDNKIRVRTIYSAISHGTEMTIYRGINPFFNKNIDKNGLFIDGKDNNYRYPFRSGYEQVGEIIEIGKNITEFKVGDRITASYGHVSEAVIEPVPHKNQIIPKDVPIERFVFFALSTVAFDSYLTSKIRLGENAVIFGLGVVGLLLLNICKIGGVNPIICVDHNEDRLKLAKKLGAHFTLNPKKIDVGLKVKSILPDKLGSDVVFETSGNTIALHNGIRCGAAGYSSLVATGFYNGDDQGLRLGEEFHHGGSIGKGGCVKILRNNNGLQPAFGRQWDRLRMAKTIIELFKLDKMKPEIMITNYFNAAEASKAYEIIDLEPHKNLKIILIF